MPQAYVRMVKGVDGTIHNEPRNYLLTRTGLRVANWTHEVQHGFPFRILVKISPTLLLRL